MLLRDCNDIFGEIPYSGSPAVNILDSFLKSGKPIGCTFLKCINQITLTQKQGYIVKIMIICQYPYSGTPVVKNLAPSFENLATVLILHF